MNESNVANQSVIAPIAAAFCAMADLCIALGEHPLHKHEGCWEHQIDEHWWIALNGHPEKRLMRKLPHMEPLEPFHAYVEWNGWPAGIITAFGGILCAGECANEDTFIAALRAATERAKERSHDH